MGYIVKSTGGYFNTSSVPSGNPGAGMTIAGWLNMASLAGNTWTALGVGYSVSGGSYYGLGVFDTSGTYNMAGYATNTGASQFTALGSLSLSAGTWYHGAATFSGNNLTVYTNAANSGSATLTGSYAGNYNALCIGALNNGGSIISQPGQNTYLNEVALWTTVLTLNEITALAKGIPPWLIRPASLWGYWPLLASPGNISANAEPDLSGNARNVSRITQTTAPTASPTNSPMNYAPLAPPVISSLVLPSTPTSAGASGPISPTSVFHNDQNGRTFEGYYSGSGGNISPNDWGIQVKASLDLDSIVQLRFPMPPVMPPGSLKLLVRGLANATTGAAKFQVSDGVAGNGISPSAISLTAETASILNWTSTSADQYNDIKIPLTSYPSPNDDLVVAIKFQTSGWSLASILTALTGVIWE